MQGFDFEEERIKTEINRLGAKRVLLQMPQGLKPHATQIAQTIQATGALPIVSIDPCYGACDLAVCDAETLGADLIIHFGHSKMMSHKAVPVLYVEVQSNLPFDGAVLQALVLLSGYTKIGLATSVQHIQALDKAKALLEKAEKTVFVGDAGQVAYAGQVTGCNYSNVTTVQSEVEAFVFVGGGLFHPLGIALSTRKPTIIADPYDNRAFLVNEEAQKILRQRFASIQEAKGAQVIGVLVGLKPGQGHIDAAIKVKAQAEKNGKVAFVLAGREITPETILEFPTIDAYVNTACPRISFDASGKFSKPVLTVKEFRVVCGEVSWENLVSGGLFEN